MVVVVVVMLIRNAAIKIRDVVVGLFGGGVEAVMSFENRYA